MGHPGVEQAARQPLARRRVADGSTAGQRVKGVGAGRGQAEHAEGCAADDDAPPVGAPHGGVEDEMEVGRDAPGRRRRSAHDAVMPASTGRTAPVTAALAGPHNHSMNAATSSGCTNRPNWWWTANDSLVANPYTPAL